MIRLYKLTRFAIPLIVFLVLVLFFWKGLGADPRQVPSALIDHPVPAFSLPSLENPASNLDQSLFRGQVSVLHVWASWCGTCKSEHPLWVDRAQEHAVVFYGLLYKDARFSSQAWLKQHTNPYRQIINDEAGRLAIDLGVSGVPETFLIDAKGIIRYKHAGPLDNRVWAQEFLPRIKRLEEH